MLVLVVDMDEAFRGFVGKILIGRSHVTVSTSMSGGPCHVATSVCELVNWTGLAPAGKGDEARINSK